MSNDIKLHYRKGEVVAVLVTEPNHLGDIFRSNQEKLKKVDPQGLDPREGTEVFLTSTMFLDHFVASYELERHIDVNNLEVLNN